MQPDDTKLCCIIYSSNYRPFASWYILIKAFLTDFDLMTSWGRRWIMVPLIPPKLPKAKMTLRRGGCAGTNLERNIVSVSWHQNNHV